MESMALINNSKSGLKSGHRGASSLEGPGDGKQGFKSYLNRSGSSMRGRDFSDQRSLSPQKSSSGRLSDKNGMPTNQQQEEADQNSRSKSSFERAKAQDSSKKPTQSASNETKNRASQYASSHSKKQEAGNKTGKSISAEAQNRSSRQQESAAEHKRAANKGQDKSVRQHAPQKNEQGESSETKSQSVDPLQKRMALKSFMKKMKEELGVDATELVSAFHTLSDKEMSQPPQQNVKKLVQAMDLNQKEQQKAEKFFRQMLAKTRLGSMKEYLQGNGRELSLEGASQNEKKGQALEKNLENMSQTFFVGREVTAKKKGEQNPKASEKQEGPVEVKGFTRQHKETSLRFAPNDGGSVKKSAMKEEGQPLEGPLKSKMDQAAQQSKHSEKKGTELPEEMQILKKQQPVKGAQAAASQNSGKEAVQQAKFTQSPYKQMNNSTSTTSENAQGREEGASKKGSSSQVHLQQAFGNSQSDSKKDNSQGEQQQGRQQNRLAALSKTFKNSTQQANDVKMNVNRAQSTAGQEAENIKDIISNARYMARKGGGEMKVQLKPEGLGQVDMKVSMENGRVNVKMATETSEAKRMIERGLGELKHTLTSQKLDVEQIKVNVSQDTANQFEQQKQEAERQFAHNFLEDFRRQNESFRENLSDMASFTEPESQTEDAADNEEEIEQQASSGQSGGGRKLDLVA